MSDQESLTPAEAARVSAAMQLAAHGTAPRVTLEDIEANIVGEHYFSGLDGRNGAIAAGTFCGVDRPQAGDADLIQLDTLTFCVLQLKNGFVVWGASKPVSAKNFNAALGVKYAREDAIKQCWPLMGYALAEKLNER
jgi:hypothetical protein